MPPGVNTASQERNTDSAPGSHPAPTIGGFVDHRVMGLQRRSMQHHTVHDRNAVLQNLRGEFFNHVRRHTEERGIDMLHLSDMSSNRNGSQRLRQRSRRADGPPHNGSQTEVLAAGNEFRADSSDSAEPDDGKL